MIISLDEEKAFDKIQHPFMIKYYQSGYKGNISQHNKSHCNKPKANIILNGEKLKENLQEQDKDAQSYHFNIVLEVLATAIKQEKEINVSKLEGKK